MASRTSILLIAKQGNGIEYNNLLNKIMGDYSNINSARAALSRTLKDLNALGFIRKRGDLIQLTNKGIAKVNMEMKNKLLLKINKMVKEKRAEENPDEFVKLLSTLIERGKQDKDLLKIAKESSSFFVSDIIDLKKKVGVKARHYSYLEGVLNKHIVSLKEMDFKNSKKTENIGLLKRFALNYANRAGLNEFPVTSNNEELLEHFQKQLGGEIKGKNLLLKKEKLAALLELIEKTKEKQKISIFLHDIELRFLEKHALLIGPALKLRSARL